MPILHLLASLNEKNTSCPCPHTRRSVMNSELHHQHLTFSLFSPGGSCSLKRHSLKQSCLFHEFVQLSSGCASHSTYWLNTPQCLANTYRARCSALKKTDDLIVIVFCQVAAFHSMTASIFTRQRALAAEAYNLMILPQVHKITCNIPCTLYWLRCQKPGVPQSARRSVWMPRHSSR